MLLGRQRISFLFLNAMLNLVSLFGIFVLLALAWLMSSRKRLMNWRIIIGGMLLQAILAAIFFQSQNWTFGGRFENGILFSGIDSFFRLINHCVEYGAGFVFNVNGRKSDPTLFQPTLLRTFAFGVLPTVIFFASLMSVLYYTGFMQLLVRGMAWIMQRTLGTSGAETLASAANVFVGHTEAPLVVKPFVNRMTMSELNALMVGGFATITGGLLAAFAQLGISPGHLVVASIISAPAALVVAKIMLPETGKPKTLGTLDATPEQTAANVIDAAAMGAKDGLKLALNIGAMLIAFLALIALLDSILWGIGEAIQYILNETVFPNDPMDVHWSLSGLFGLLFWPLAWLMGIESGDCYVAGDLLGKKMVANEFVAYIDLGQIIDNSNKDVPEKTIATLSDRSQIILTYALAGFSNFGAIAIQIGGIGSIAEKRRRHLAKLGLRAMLGGMIACCLTACFAGLFYFG